MNHPSSIPLISTRPVYIAAPNLAFACSINAAIIDAELAGFEGMATGLRNMLAAIFNGGQNSSVTHG